MRGAQLRWWRALLMLALACALGGCAEADNGSATGAEYVQSDNDTDAEGAGEHAPIAPGPDGPTTTAVELSDLVFEPHDGDASGGAAITLNGYVTPTAGSAERTDAAIEETEGVTETGGLASPTPTAD